MIVSLRHLFGWIVSAFRSREDLVLEKLGSPSATARFARATASHLHKLFWVVENVLVWVEEASRLGYSQ